MWRYQRLLGTAEWRSLVAINVQSLLLSLPMIGRRAHKSFGSQTTMASCTSVAQRFVPREKVSVSSTRNLEVARRRARSSELEGVENDSDISPVQILNSAGK